MGCVSSVQSQKELNQLFCLQQLVQTLMNPHYVEVHNKLEKDQRHHYCSVASLQRGRRVTNPGWLRNKGLGTFCYAKKIQEGLVRFGCNLGRLIVNLTLKPGWHPKSTSSSCVF